MFITFEGSEGSGKTSQISPLADFLREAGYRVLTTREPGGTPLGDQIREILWDPGNADMGKHSEILLFQASRAQLVERVIRPHLQSGGVVLSDRYADSTLAYQGYGYEIDLQILRPIIAFATGGLKPDLTLFLDLPVEVGLKRRAQGGGINRLDALDPGFYRRVRQGYYEMVQAEPLRWVVIDANRALEEVQQDIRRVVMERLG